MATIVAAVCETMRSQKEQTAQDGFFCAAKLESTAQVTNDGGRFF